LWARASSAPQPGRATVCPALEQSRGAFLWVLTVFAEIKSKSEIQLRRRIMFAVIRHYHFNPKDSAEIDRRVHEDFVPIVKKAKGFVRYYWLDSGKGEGASVSVFNDKAGADESVHLAADYVRDNLSKVLTQKPEIIEGPIKAHD
jgi:hypothetical protein